MKELKRRKTFSVLVLILVFVSGCSLRNSPAEETPQTGDISFASPRISEGISCSEPDSSTAQARDLTKTVNVVLAIDVSPSMRPNSLDSNNQAKSVIETLYATVMSTGIKVNLSIIGFSNEPRYFSDLPEKITWTRDTSHQEITINGGDLNDFLEKIDNIKYEQSGAETSFVNLINFIYTKMDLFDPIQPEEENLVFVIGNLRYGDYEAISDQTVNHVEDARREWAKDRRKRNEIGFYFFSLGQQASEASAIWQDTFFVSDTATGTPIGEVTTVERIGSSEEINRILGVPWESLPQSEKLVNVDPNLVGLDVVFLMPYPFQETTIISEPGSLAGISSDTGIPLQLLRALNPGYQEDQVIAQDISINLPAYYIRIDDHESPSVSNYSFGDEYYQVWEVTSPTAISNFTISGIRNTKIVYNLVEYLPRYLVELETDKIPEDSSVWVQASFQGQQPTDIVTATISGTDLATTLVYNSDGDQHWFSGQLFFPSGLFDEGDYFIDVEMQRGQKALYSTACSIHLISAASILEYGPQDIGQLYPGGSFLYDVSIHKDADLRPDLLSLYIDNLNDKIPLPVRVPLTGQGESLTGEISLQCPKGAFSQVNIRTFLEQRIPSGNPIKDVRYDTIKCNCENAFGRSLSSLTQAILAGLISGVVALIFSKDLLRAIFSFIAAGVVYALALLALASQDTAIVISIVATLSGLLIGNIKPLLNDESTKWPFLLFATGLDIVLWWSILQNCAALSGA